MRPERPSRWLDSLARWSVGGRASPRHRGHGLEAEVSGGGTTRRTALRAAAGAAGTVALAGPLSLAQPVVANAAQTNLEKCRGEGFKKAYDFFQSCVRRPLEEFEAAGEAIASDEDLLINEKRPAVRKRLLKHIDRETKRRGRALGHLEFCNGIFLGDRDGAAEKCDADVNPPGGTEGNAPQSPGCEVGYALCGDYCCNSGVAYCQGCGGTPTCCRIEGNCCPGSE